MVLLYTEAQIFNLHLKHNMHVSTVVFVNGDVILSQMNQKCSEVQELTMELNELVDSNKKLQTEAELANFQVSYACTCIINFLHVGIRLSTECSN